MCSSRDRAEFFCAVMLSDGKSKVPRSCQDEDGMSTICGHKQCRSQCAYEDLVQLTIAAGDSMSHT